MLPSAASSPLLRLLAAVELASTTARGGPLGVRGAKVVIDALDSGLSFEEHVELSNEHRFPLNDTEDFKEALAAFAEKRAPIFRGR